MNEHVTRAATLTLLIAAGCGGPEASQSQAVSASTQAPTPAPASAAVHAATTTSTEAPAASSAAAPADKTWTFDADPAGQPPAGFAFGRTGGGREGKWMIKAEPGAPSGANVLAQTDADTTDYRFPVAFADAPVLRDLDLSVRCKPVSGHVDQACGLVFRLKDANDYYLTRANALENNVRLYTVRGGKRDEIASFSGKVASGAWHTLRVVAQGDHLEVHWDGAKVIDHHDKTFDAAGKVGVWTKADSVTYFDDLSVKALAP